MTPAVLRLLNTCDVQEDGCWLWTGHIDKKSGYGRLTFHGRTLGAHRLAYETFIGPIADGLHIDHLCRVRNCIAPLHLEAVSQAENNRRAAAVAAAGRPPKPAPRPRKVAAPKPPRRPSPAETGVRKCGHPYLGPGDCPQCARDRAARYREQVAKGAVPLRLITCTECSQERPNCAKGLCRRCYTRLYKRAAYVPASRRA